MSKNTFWSTKVQSTEVLYTSRNEKFNEENIEDWLKYFNISDGMKILEVGCGGGNFTNMIKRKYPSCQVFGIDLDENHIKFAKKHAKNEEIDVNYQIADIKSLPFDDDSFDIVCSHTVVEHLPFDEFILEQKRVLKPNGKIVIMRVAVEDIKHDTPFMEYEEEINKTYSHLIMPKDSYKAKYSLSPQINMQQLSEFGFYNIKLNFERFVYYCPDIYDFEVAKKQIKRNYETKLYFSKFCLSIAENGKDYEKELLSLLEKQYNSRLDILNRGQKLFDYQSSNVIIITACKKRSKHD